MTGSERLAKRERRVVGIAMHDNTTGEAVSPMGPKVESYFTRRLGDLPTT